MPKAQRNFFNLTKFWKDNSLILKQVKNFRKIAILAVIFSFLAASFEGVSIGFLLSFLQKLTTPNQPIQTGIGWLDIILTSNLWSISPIYRISLLILLSTWMRATFNYFSAIYTESAQLHLADSLHKLIFEQLQSLRLSYFSQTNSGELINVLTTEIERIKQSFSGAAFLFTRILTICVYFIVMFSISWQLSIISVLIFALLGVGLSTLNKRVRETSFGISSANAKFTAIAVEFINGIRTVQAFSTQEFERQRFYQASTNQLNAAIKVVMAWTMVRPIAEGVATTVLISLIVISFTTFTLPVASLLTFFFVLVRVIPNIQDINGTFAALNTLQGSLENIRAILQTDDKPYLRNGKLKFPGLKRSIDLVSVDFGYTADNIVLSNITLTIERGKTTALVGSSGAGKTTLADLIPRFYDPTQGQILVDGIDLQKLEINSFRRKMAIVSQDTFIFNASIRDNIVYGTAGASEAEIREVARLANALEFIEQMPQGLDTNLGDRGVRLSGGQRQRIAIARALLRNPEILILDEATSALDSVSERLIQESLEKLSQGKTVIAIAHRLSTIAKADKVVVLEQGRIVEQGGYQELLELKGKLWKYHQMQYESTQAD
jgi:ATP-binding cassette, subfamily B, bacterial MsbA